MIQSPNVTKEHDIVLQETYVTNKTCFVHVWGITNMTVLVLRAPQASIQRPHRLADYSDGDEEIHFSWMLRCLFFAMSFGLFDRASARHLA